MTSKPLAAEYAKSGKAGCKGCKDIIEKGKLRVGFTGKANFGATAWYHYDCVWKEKVSLADIDGDDDVGDLVEGIQSLDKTDKTKLEKDVKKYSKEAKVSAAEPSKETKSTKPLAAEYAKSGKSTCKECGKVIEKNSLRIGFTGKANFGATAWYHDKCIWEQSRDSFSGMDSSKDLSAVVEGYDDLRTEAQELIKKKLPAACGGSVGSSNKRKSTSGTSDSSSSKKGKK